MNEFIIVRQARENNLKGLDLEIPLGKLTVVSGPSGAGKTSLVVDTLFAESQRRFIETVGVRRRNRFGLWKRPKADRIENIPPAINASGQADSSETLAQISELDEAAERVFRLLGLYYCPDCLADAWNGSPSTLALKLQSAFPGRRAMVAFALSNNEEAEVEKCGERENKKRENKERDEGEGDVKKRGGKEKAKGKRDANGDEWSDSISRDSISQRLTARKAELVQIGLSRQLIPTSEGQYTIQDLARAATPQVSTANQKELRQMGADSLILVDRLTIPKFVFMPGDDSNRSSSETTRLTDSLEIAFSEGSQQAILFIEESGGNESGGNESGGDDGKLEAASEQRGETTVEGRRFLRRYVGLRPCCSVCGKPIPTDNVRFRLGPVADEESVGESVGEYLSRSDFYRLSANELLPVLARHRELFSTAAANPNRQTDSPDDTELSVYKKYASKIYELDYFQRVGSKQTLANRLNGIDSALEKLVEGLKTLQDCALGTLPLETKSETLSVNQIKRAHVAAMAESDLCNTLFTLDEPADQVFGAEIPRLLKAVLKIRDRDNTVVVVEHNPEFIAAADNRIVLINGDLCPPDEFIANTYIQKDGSRSANGTNNGQRLAAAQVSCWTDLSLDSFPNGKISIVCGKSGTGKTRLFDKLQQECAQRGQELTAIPNVPLVRSGGSGSRGCVATALKIWDKIRDELAQTPDAQTQGLTPGAFSFSSTLGRCPECKGEGVLKIDMPFMPDMEMVCDECSGQRFKREILQVRYRNLNAAEILNLSAIEAFSFFRGAKKVQMGLKSLVDIGLGYLPLGQRLKTLSTGELQRLRLAGPLAGLKRTATIFLLEEPSSGLSPADLQPLVGVLRNLVSFGHTVIAFDNNSSFQSEAADRLWELRR